MHNGNVLLIAATAVSNEYAGRSTGLPFTKVLANSRLVEAICLEKEARDILGLIACNESVLDEELNALSTDS